MLQLTGVLVFVMCAGCRSIPCEVVIYNNSSRPIENPQVVFSKFTAKADLVQPGGMAVSRTTWSPMLSEAARVQWIEKGGKTNTAQIAAVRDVDPALSGLALQVFFQICDGGEVKTFVKTNPVDGWK